MPSWSRYLAALLVAGVIGFLIADAASQSDEARPADAGAAKRLMVALDNAQLCFWERHERFAGGIAELEENLWQMRPEGFGAGLQSRASLQRLEIDLDVSRNGRFYVQRISGEGVDRSLARRSLDFVDYGDLGNEDLREDCRLPR